MSPSVLLLYLISYGSRLRTPLVVEQSVYATFRTSQHGVTLFGIFTHRRLFFQYNVVQKFSEQRLELKTQHTVTANLINPGPKLELTSFK